jgi:hypothetical protein
LHRHCGAAPAAALSSRAAQALRNLASVEGVRENPLVGYGLVVGLNGSGDSTQVKYSSQSVVNMLKQFGVKMPEGQDAKNKNVAAVMVSAVFPPGYRRGQAIDVTVSSLGDAKSLRGGTLLLTQLRAADNEIYALAQGNLVVGGLAASGKSGSSVTVNTPTGGRIPNGAQIEREIPSDFATRPQVLLRCATRTSTPPPTSSRRSTAASARSPPPPTAPASKWWRRPIRPSAWPSWPSWKACRSKSAREVPKRRVQLAHRHRGDLRRPAREVGRRDPRLAQGGDLGKLGGEPARPVLERPDHGHAAIEGVGGPGLGPDVPLAGRRQACRPSSTWSTAWARRRTTSWRSCRRSTRPARSKANWW